MSFRVGPPLLGCLMPGQVLLGPNASELYYLVLAQSFWTTQMSHWLSILLICHSCRHSNSYMNGSYSAYTIYLGEDGKALCHPWSAKKISPLNHPILVKTLFHCSCLSLLIFFICCNACFLIRACSKIINFLIIFVILGRLIF